MLENKPGAVPSHGSSQLTPLQDCRGAQQLMLGVELCLNNAKLRMCHQQTWSLGRAAELSCSSMSNA